MRERRLRKGLVFGMIFVLLASMVVITVPINVSAVPTNRFVDGDWTASTCPVPAQWGTIYFNKITTAIAACSSIFKDTIFVYEANNPYTGTMTVPRITIGKSLNLVSLGREDFTIIDGSGNADVIKITADDVDIYGSAVGNGFTIKSSGPPDFKTLS